jgi:glycosyltransferase involved in cell wall biosynthesis
MIGGIENYVLGVGEELVALGHEVRIFTPESVLGNRFRSPRETVRGMDVHRVKVSFDLSYRVKLWPSLMGELRATNSDIIHVYSHDSYALFALLAARETGTPMLITTYGPLSTHADYGPLQSGLFRAYDLVVSPSLFRGSEIIMMRYPEIERWLAKMGVAKGKMRLEPSGIPRESTGTRDGSLFRERHGITGPLVLYLGRISPQKGVNFAVRAMKHVSTVFPEARLAIIGPDYTGYSQQIRSLASELGLAEKVLLIPPMADEETQLEALAASDVFVMPSSFEGFSQSVMKAMAQGKPVVVTDVGGLSFEVGGGSCGSLCAYGDYEEMAEGIIQFLGNPDIARMAGKEGRERAKLFTFDVLARSNSETYSQLAA